MKTENVKLLVENFAKLEQHLLKYNEIGSSIMKIESEEVEELTEKVQARDEIIKEMDKVKSSCTELIDGFEPEESALIRGMLTGTNINQRISDELAPLQNAIVSLRSAQLQAAESDKALQTQFASRVNEAKEELVQLKNDKKKLDYYSSVNPTGKLGGSLDSSF